MTVHSPVPARGSLKAGQTLGPCTLTFLKATTQRAASTELLDGGHEMVT